MLDQLVTEATKPILDVGLIGSLCLLLLATVIVRERYWTKREGERETKHDAEMAGIQAALTEAQKALLAEARSNMAAMHLLQDQMKSQEVAFEAFTRAVERR